jgi:hypothetical protein
MREKFIMHYGDPIVGEHSTEETGLVCYEPEEKEKPTLDGLTYGEKKTLMSFYSLGNEKLNGYYFYKIEDLWQGYFYLNGQRTLGAIGRTLFDLCSQIVLGLESEELSNQFINGMRFYESEEEADKFIESLKKKQEEEGPKLNLVPKDGSNKKDII